MTLSENAKVRAIMITTTLIVLGTIVLFITLWIHGQREQASLDTIEAQLIAGRNQLQEKAKPKPASQPENLPLTDEPFSEIEQEMIHQDFNSRPEEETNPPSEAESSAEVSNQAVRSPRKPASRSTRSASQSETKPAAKPEVKPTQKPASTSSEPFASLGNDQSLLDLDQSPYSRREPNADGNNQPVEWISQKLNEAEAENQKLVTAPDTQWYALADEVVEENQQVETLQKHISNDLVPPSEFAEVTYRVTFGPFPTPGDLKRTSQFLTLQGVASYTFYAHEHQYLQTSQPLNVHRASEIQKLVGREGIPAKLDAVEGEAFNRAQTNPTEPADWLAEVLGSGS